MQVALWSGEDSSSKELSQEISNAVKTIQDCLGLERKLPDVGTEVVNDLCLNKEEYIKQKNHMPFIILPFDSKYQSQLIDLIERIQVEEFSIPRSSTKRTSINLTILSKK